MVNKKNCKRNCEYKSVINNHNIIVHSISAGGARRKYKGMFRACRECAKIFLRKDGLPYTELFCFCCGARLGNKPKNNIARKEYNLKRERLKLGAVAAI